MSDNGAYSTAEDLRKRYRLDVEIDGEKYEIKKIGPAKMASIGGSIDLMPFLKQAKKNTVPDEAEAEGIIAFRDKVCVAGVCSHALVILGDGEKPKDDEFDIDELPEHHKTHLWLAILVLSRLSKEEAEKLRPFSPTQEP